MSYDYTVLAGTQGMRNHLKKDRLFEIAERRRVRRSCCSPRAAAAGPATSTVPHVAGLDVRAFHLFARLSGLVPLVGIASGYCFAGNAALLGCCDVVIATEDSSIGMGGPAMIEGGGLGVFDPDRRRADRRPGRGNGVVDLRVPDEAAGGAGRQTLPVVLRRGPQPGDHARTDAATLRDLVPANRKRIYDVRAVIDALSRTTCSSCGRGFGAGIVTALARRRERPPARA